MVIQEDEADDLLETVDRGLKQLRYGALSLLQVEADMPKRVLQILIENFEVDEDVVARTADRLGFGDWHALTKLHRPALKYPAFQQRTLWAPDETDKVFDQIADQDFLLHHPFDSFTSIETFLRAAVEDPHVVTIKITLYRIGPNSPLVDLLIQAAELGKQVAVVVELKARFDERNNIAWATRLEEAGIHVVYGLMNLKVHCKLCLVVRKESDGIHRYAHVATGNYNRITSQVYTDLGLFTADEGVLDDITEVFNSLTGYSNRRSYNSLLVAPVGLRQGIRALVEREIEHAKAGRPARIIIKNNAVADHGMIKILYRASQAGVPIDMIVRGVCCLRPGIPGISDRIQVRSIVGQFLEHSRIYYFENGGAPEVYIGSADLMERNLDRRVEVLCPILDPAMRQLLRDAVLEVLLSDTDRAWTLQTDGTYTRAAAPEGVPPLNSQRFLLEWYAAQHETSLIRDPALRQFTASETASAIARTTPGPRSARTAISRGHRGDDWPFVHDRAHRIVQGRQRQHLDERLHRVGEVRRREEHARQHPHRQHHEVHQPGDRFDGARAAGEQQAEPAERQRADQRQPGERDHRAVHPDVEEQPREPDDHRHFQRQKQQPAEDMRHQVVRLRHRCRHQPLEQLLGARLDNRKPDAPEAGAHDVHAEQSRHQPVDVARANVLHRLLHRREGIGAAGGTL